MIAFEQMIEDLEAINLNLYDFAFSSSEGDFFHTFLPSNACLDCYSIGKAFVMTAVGLLFDEGLLRPEDSVFALIKDLFPVSFDPGWRLVSVENALTHKIGFAADFLAIDSDNCSAYPTNDYLELVLKHKLKYSPGSHFTYSDAAAYLLSRLVEHVCGKPTDQLLMERLFIPLGFREIAWSRCPKGHIIGASGVYMRTDDMVKLARLYLDGGVWRGKQLLSMRWVRRALEREYEFHMMTPGGLIGKGGSHGQGLVLSMEARFAAAWHAYEDSAGVERLINYLDALKC